MSRRHGAGEVSLYINMQKVALAVSQWSLFDKCSLNWDKRDLRHKFLLIYILTHIHSNVNMQTTPDIPQSHHSSAYNSFMLHPLFPHVSLPL